MIDSTATAPSAARKPRTGCWTVERCGGRRLRVDQERWLLVRFRHPIGERSAENQDEQQLGHDAKLRRQS
jgi:hypothetical protein